MSENDGLKSPVSAKWDEIKVLVEELDLDAAKNSRGVAAAGVRLRKGLRLIKKECSELVKLTVTLDNKKS